MDERTYMFIESYKALIEAESRLKYAQQMLTVEPKKREKIKELLEQLKKIIEE